MGYLGDGGDLQRVKLIHLGGVDGDANAARLGVHAEGGLEQVVQPLADVDVEARVRELQHDLVDVPLPDGALLLHDGLHPLPAVDRVLADPHRLRLELLPEVVERDEGEHLVPALLVGQDVLDGYSVIL